MTESSENPLHLSECYVGLGMRAHVDTYWQRIIVRGVPAQSPPILWIKYGEQHNQVKPIKLRAVDNKNIDWYASNINYDLPAGVRVEVLLELPHSDCTHHYKTKV